MIVNNIQKNKYTFLGLSKYLYINSINKVNNSINIKAIVDRYNYTDHRVKLGKQIRFVIKQYNNRSILLIYNDLLKKLLYYNKIYNNQLSYNTNNYNIFLNFKSNRFFPYFYNDNKKEVLFNSSLGIFSRKFSQKKSYLKSKNAYIMSMTYIRRLLIYIAVKRLNLNILKTPKYLKELLIVLNNNSNVIYNHPFRNETVNEKEIYLNIKFCFINFINNKSLGPIKKKKRGRLKRKIAKKITLYNNVLD
jgi:hypothetical protein